MFVSPKPKPLRDVRYFESVEPLRLGQSMPDYASELYAVPTEAVAVGRRIAMKCEELGISIGRADHLYVCFTPSLPDTTIDLTQYTRDPWHRFVVCGLSYDFNTLTDEKRREAVTDLTFKALHLLAPNATTALDSLSHMIKSEGESLRVQMKCKETKDFLIHVEQNIAAAPRYSEIFVRVTNRQKKLTKEMKVAQVRFYDEASSLVDRISIKNNHLTIHPRKSFRASLITADYHVPIQVDLTELGVS